MLTDKDIITNQVSRISGKTKTNLSARIINVLWYLYQGENIAPFGSANIGRTADQMIEYLAGLEDAIDYYTKQKE